MGCGSILPTPYTLHNLRRFAYILQPKKLPKILAIDDDSIFLELLIEWLSVNEFDAIVAASGRQGLELAQTQLPDLIICDIRMPGVDGYQVLTALRQNPVTQNIPLIFLTSENKEYHAIRAQELGANACLNKFYLGEELRRVIQEQLSFNI
ncbi:MAG TPA: hypothetical protein DDZ80_26985 [Cyanobacteria bacterium UBA8803]|nr:hypothetical protein [Cyanobacteria bacterium UBA9273]HBL61922.1 hypothetical protein [Cyanobacteria bacterium UBA8803]